MMASQVMIRLVAAFTVAWTSVAFTIVHHHHNHHHSPIVRVGRTAPLSAGGFEWDDPQEKLDQGVSNPFKNDELTGDSSSSSSSNSGSDSDSGSDSADDADDLKVDPARLLGPRLEGCNIYFVGMMGCGKTAVGDIVARRMGSYNFLDTDSILEKAVGCSIPEIFETEGEDAFRDVESQILDSVHAYVRCVISTGGGIVVRPNNWSKLQSGVVVYLDVPAEVLMTRLRNSSTPRPLLQTADPRQTLDTLLDARDAKYRQADVTVCVDADMSPDATADLVVKELHNFIDNNPPAWKKAKAKAQEEGLDWVQ